MAASLAIRGDLTQQLSKSLDRHLVFPLLEFLFNRQLYEPDDIQKAKIALLGNTNMVDYAMDIHESLYDKGSVPQEMVDRRAEVSAGKWDAACCARKRQRRRLTITISRAGHRPAEGATGGRGDDRGVPVERERREAAEAGQGFQLAVAPAGVASVDGCLQRFSFISYASSAASL